MPPKKKSSQDVVRTRATTRSMTKASAAAKAKAKGLLTSPPEVIQTRSQKSPKGIKKQDTVAMKTKTCTTTTKINKTITKTLKPAETIKLNANPSKSVTTRINARGKYTNFDEYMLLKAINDAQQTCRLNPEDELAREYLDAELARYENHFPPMTAEEKRIKHLKDMKTRDGLREGHITNIDALIRDYQNGKIKYNKGKGYYYYKGELILGPFPSGEFMKKMHTSTKVKKLVKTEGDSLNFRENAWFETFEEVVSMASWVMFYNEMLGGGIGMIDYPIHVRRVKDPTDANELWAPIPSIRRIVMDDTGASMPSLSIGLDGISLGIGIKHVGAYPGGHYESEKVTYKGWQGVRDCHTNNGMVVRECVVLEVALGRNDLVYPPEQRIYPISRWREHHFLLLPGDNVNFCTRLGGPILRTAGWQLTAPKHLDTLWVATSKDELFKLPVDYVEEAESDHAVAVVSDGETIDPRFLDLSALGGPKV